MPIKDRLLSMADGGRAYIRALREFHDYLFRHGIILTDETSVDRALFGYISGLRRYKAEHRVGYEQGIPTASLVAIMVLRSDEPEGIGDSY